MSKLYAVYAYEQQYGGLHGINNCQVIECADEEEANMFGHEMSLEVIEDYINLDEFYDDDEEYDFDEFIEEDVAYEVYELKETTEPLNKLNEMFYNDMEDFLEKYAI